MRSTIERCEQGIVRAKDETHGIQGKFTFHKTAENKRPSFAESFASINTRRTTDLAHAQNEP